MITHPEHKIPVDSTSNLVPTISPLAFVLGQCKEVDFVLNRSFARWRYFTTKTRMLCQNAFLFKFIFSLGNEETIGKSSLTIEATNRSS